MNGIIHPYGDANRVEPGHAHSARSCLPALLSGLMLLALAGCQNITPTPELQKEVKEALELSRQQTQPTPPTIPEIHPPPPPAVREPEPLFDIQVTGAPMRSVLEGLVAGTPYSLVLDPKIEGQISLDLKQVTVTEAVEVICRMQQLDCQKMRRGFMIFPNQVTSKEFQVHYPDMDRKGTSSLRVSSGQN
ncbi:MAG: hypothetical protein HQL66_06950, partial [Magnetococcales bacterium]|nr:hypothetical protein [Magnetococcales bacterium]